MTEAKAEAPKTTQLTTLQKKAISVGTFLNQRKASFAELLPKHLTPERMVKGVLAAATRNPAILDCTLTSLLNCIIVAGEMGLDVGRPRGGMHLVPFNNKKIRQKEAVAIPDYRGLIDLAYRSGRVLLFTATGVYEEDVFDYQRGTEPFVRHKPALDKRGKLVRVYSVAIMRDGLPGFEVMNLEEVNVFRDRSKASKEGPWVTDYLPMALKTVVKRLVNWLPQNPETDLLHRALELDGRMEAAIESGTPQGIGDLFGVIEEAPTEATGGDAIKKKFPKQGTEERQEPDGVVTVPPTAENPLGVGPGADAPPYMQKVMADLTQARRVGPEDLVAEWGMIVTEDDYQALSPIQQEELGQFYKKLTEDIPV